MFGAEDNQAQLAPLSKLTVESNYEAWMLCASGTSVHLCGCASGTSVHLYGCASGMPVHLCGCASGMSVHLCGCVSMRLWVCVCV